MSTKKPEDQNPAQTTEYAKLKERLKDPNYVSSVVLDSERDQWASEMARQDRDEEEYEAALRKQGEAASNKAIEAEIEFTDPYFYPAGPEGLEPLIAECEDEDHDDLMDVSDESVRFEEPLNPKKEKR